MILFPLHLFTVGSCPTCPAAPSPYIYLAIWWQLHGQLTCGMVQVSIGLGDFILSPFSNGQSLR